jgi:dipeptidyl aminopeptidase/acylaminoacyl peptidase
MCSRPITAGKLDGPVSGLKLASVGQNSFAFVVSGQQSPNGTLYNPVSAPEPITTGRVYTQLFFRHWDTWTTKERNTLFYGTIEKGYSKDNTSAYALKPSAPVNALKNLGLESPIPPFGGTDNYDISSTGIIFVAKDPKLNQATTTKSDFYFIPLASFTETSAPKPVVFSVPGLQGASSSPVFSPDGKQAAFLQMKDIAYESDKNRIIVVQDITKPSSTIELLTSKDGKGSWQLSPSTVSWSTDGKTLYVTLEDTGRGTLYKLPSDPKQVKDLPTKITKNGYISELHPLTSDPKDGRLFVTSTSLIDNSLYQIVDPSDNGAITVSSNSKNGTTFGLSQSQVSEIWYPGAAAGVKIHAWVLKPSNFDPKKTYPLAYLIHGGPQGSWGESWSTRWNPAVYAEQGYVVIAPNPTGSTGYGQALTDAIQNQWGGLPYQDLVNGFTYIERELKYVDTSRAVALGASYGGYMIVSNLNSLVWLHAN